MTDVSVFLDYRGIHVVQEVDGEEKDIAFVHFSDISEWARKDLRHTDPEAYTDWFRIIWSISQMNAKLIDELTAYRRRQRMKP